MVNVDQFWNLIDEARGTGLEGDELFEEIVASLLNLPDSDLVDYSEICVQLLNDAMRWELWDAIFLINGGCSDDSFFDFRDFLLSKGREHFERIVNDPELLLDDELGPGWDGWPYWQVGFSRAAKEAYERRYKKSDDPDLELEYKCDWLPTKGNRIDTQNEDEVKLAFPRIWEHRRKIFDDASK